MLCRRSFPCDWGKTSNAVTCKLEAGFCAAVQALLYIDRSREVEGGANSQEAWQVGWYRVRQRQEGASLSASEWVSTNSIVAKGRLSSISRVELDTRYAL